MSSQLESDLDKFLFLMASYPMEVYSELDKETATIFLNCLLLKNYSIGELSFGNIFINKNEYSEYLCEVAQMLLQKYYKKVVRVVITKIIRM
jgi:hypothetical protein